MVVRAVANIEGVSWCRGKRGAITEAVSRFQGERDLPLVDIENITYRHPRELVVGVVRVLAAVQKIRAITDLRGCVVHGTAGVHDSAGVPGRSDVRANYRSVRGPTNFGRIH